MITSIPRISRLCFIYNFCNVACCFVQFGTPCFTLREERRLRVFENRVLRKIFGPKRDEVTGDWRKLYNERNDLYSLPNIVRVIRSRRTRRSGHVARMGEGRIAYRVLMGRLR
jgi:hypothetical protein